MALAVPAFIAGLLWSSIWGPSTKEGDICIGSIAACAGAVSGIALLRRAVARRPARKGRYEAIALFSGIAMFALFCKAIIH